MRLTTSTALLVGMAISSSSVAFGQELPAPSNRIANMGAESNELAPWAGTGFAIGEYGRDPAPPTGVADRSALGRRYFAATVGGGTSTQEANIADLADTVDKGDATFYVRAYLGAAAGTVDDPWITYQPLSADGLELGSPTRLGPSTPDERRGQTDMIDHNVTFPMPTGARRVRVTLTAGGTPGASSTAAIDRIYLEPKQYTSPGGSGTGTGTGTAPPASSPPAASASPPAAGIAAPAKLTTLRLVRNAVIVRSSRDARVGVVLERLTPATDRKAQRWKPSQTLTIRAKAGETTTRRLKRLARGTYRISARIGSGRALLRQRTFRTR